MAAGGSEGRNEVKFFEAADDAHFKPTFVIADFATGVTCSDFSAKGDRLVVGTAGGLVAGFRLKINAPSPIT